MYTTLLFVHFHYTIGNVSTPRCALDLKAKVFCIEVETLKNCKEVSESRCSRSGFETRKKPAKEDLVNYPLILWKHWNRYAAILYISCTIAGFNRSIRVACSGVCSNLQMLLFFFRVSRSTVFLRRFYN